jgi:tetratricopeptide (TPR) repeat protein
MKAEHRHELKTNELAEWLANLPKWAKENLRMIIYFAVVIIAVIAVWIWRGYQENVVSLNQKLRLSGLLRELAQDRYTTIQQQAQGIDVSYTLLQTANKLQDFADRIPDADMAAMALIKSAEALRSELHYRIGPIDNEAYSSQIAKARAAYESAIKRAQNNPSLRASATLGLGLCAEEIRNFTEAKEIYRKIVEDPNFAATIAAASAKYRLEVMDEYKQMALFTAPPVTPGPTLEPSILQPDIGMESLAPPESEINMPAEE